MGTQRHLFIAIMSSLIATYATAQFDALPDSNAAWTESFWIGPGYPYEGVFHTYDSVSPDTVLDGEVYQKLLTTYSSNFNVSGAVYGGALRDNGLGQVYYWAPGEAAPALLYDFDVQVGDTVEDVYSIWTQDVRVYSVDEIEVNGTMRKRIGLECLEQPVFLGAYWIQGVGANGGLFRTTACPSVSGAGALVCMTVNDTVQWGTNVGEVGDCSLLLGGPELASNEMPLRIHPNPATDRLSFTDPVNTRVEVEVIGPDGRTVLALPFTGTELSINGLPAGAYVLKVHGTTGMVRMARFVKY